MIRRCIICGAEFSTPPSNNRRTCSPACSSQWRSKQHMGVSNRWSEGVKAAARAAAAKTGNLKNGTAAAMNLPESQRGPQNRGAMVWHLRDPEGRPVIATNLLDWARRHAKDFGMDSTDAAARRIASGFRQIKLSAEGKRFRRGRLSPVSSYKGWTLVAWGPKPHKRQELEGEQ